MVVSGMTLDAHGRYLVYLEDMADLTRDDILKLARLARISLSDDEVHAFAGEFTEIIRYVEMLDAIDVTGKLPTSQVTGLTNVTRDDTVIEYGYDAQAMLENLPRTTEQGQIKVRRMIG